MDYSNTPSTTPSSTFLAYFGNLPPAMTTPTLQSILSLCGGAMKSLKRPADSFALVEFTSPEPILTARRLFEGFLFGGKEISVKSEEIKVAEEEGEVREEEEGEVEVGGKRRELERILNQKRIPFERSVRREVLTIVEKKEEVLKKQEPTQNELAKWDQRCRAMESELKDAQLREEDRRLRHAREVELVKRDCEAGELAIPSANNLNVALESDFQSRREAKSKEREIFKAVIEGERRRIELLPVKYRSNSNSKSNGDLSHLTSFAIKVCKRLGLPGKLGKIALSLLTEEEALELLCAEPLYLLSAKGRVEAEILLTCLLRAIQ